MLINIKEFFLTILIIENLMSSPKNIGIIGLGLMGKNLSLNMIKNGVMISIYDQNKLKIEELYDQVTEKPRIQKSYSISELVSSLAKPKTILMMINAGPGVDDVLEELFPLLSKGDIIIDGGNSNFQDTQRRFHKSKSENIEFVGMGVSGGAKGALYGPSLMVGGSWKAWEHIQPILYKIAAKYNNNPCCEYIGSDGAGHYVKMIHNGIEYGIMQIISELYDFMRKGKNYSNEEMSDIFAKWNDSRLNSYLLEITAKILKAKDPTSGDFIVDGIRDTASQKGTGKWTAISSIELGYPGSILISSVLQRYISSDKNKRMKISQKLFFSKNLVSSIKESEIEEAFFAGILLTYLQGLEIIKHASVEYNWNISMGNVLSTWKAGCIIRASILDLFETDDKDDILLANDQIVELINSVYPSLQRLLVEGIELSIPMPGLSAGFNYLTSYSNEKLPANLIQAQRDFFGSHGYQKIQDKTDSLYFSKWDEINNF